MNDAAENALTREPDDDIGLAAQSRWDRLLRTRLVETLGKLRDCELRLIDYEGEITLGSPAAHASETLRCTLQVHDPSFFRAIAANGSVGAAEAYMDGAWSCDDLVALVRILVRNRDLLDSLEKRGMARIGGWIMRAAHAFRRNTRAGSRRNIEAHYDLGNELFELFLDDTMMYSSAIFACADESLDSASRRKLDRICRKLELSPQTSVVEIGTGWGGFALHAAAHFGCHVTTTTISREQHEMAQRRVQEAGLGDRVTLLLKDYRELDGSYDRLVSIEMVEAIGHQYLDGYFRKVADLLKPDGAALIQAITIEDHRYEQALHSVDFIKRYIFPGSFIPCVNALVGAAAKTDLRLFNLEDIGPSYALTLNHWRQRFLGHRAEVRKLGYPDRFIRMWEFYLAYCEGGFIERALGDVHLLFTRPLNRRAEWLPQA